MAGTTHFFSNVDVVNHNGVDTGLTLGGVLVTATAAEINTLDVSASSSLLTVSGAVPVGTKSIELNHATTPIAATIADLTLYRGFLMIKDTSASGTAAHTVTVTTGTLDGTNKIATLDAPGEALCIFVDSNGNGTVIANVGAVVLS